MAEAKTIHAAFAEAYAEMTNPKKNASNPAFRSKYANLEELLAVTRPILAACGLSLVQQPISEEDRIGVHTLLHHASGELMDFGGYTVPLVKHDAQGAGSALTYTRRYAIAAIFGLAQEDDDGNSASRAPQAAQPARTSPPSEKQVKAVWAFGRSAGLENDALVAWLAQFLGIEDGHPDMLTTQQASKAIDELKVMATNAGIEAKAAEKAPEPKDGALLTAYKELMVIADLNGTKDAVKAALGNPKTGEAALAMYGTLGVKRREALEAIARGEAGDAQ